MRIGLHMMTRGKNPPEIKCNMMGDETFPVKEVNTDLRSHFALSAPSTTLVCARPAPMSATNVAGVDISPKNAQTRKMRRG